MQIELGPELERFRQDMQSWVAANRQEDLATVDAGIPTARPAALAGRRGDAYRAWEQASLEAGLVCPQWPTQVGGRGLSAIEMAILNEELARAAMPRINRGMGESLVGPSIIVHGTDEQKAHFLQRIVTGQDRYCQGFSEPNSGSDLASLQCRGVVEGDEIVVTGQKVWTSGADAANMIFCLCRTDPAVPKHRGITYALLPMKDNGVTIRPLKQMSGASGFFEVFLDGARAPLFNVIGGLNNGWRVAMTTLGNERGGSATTQHLRFEREFWELVEVARRRGRDRDPLVRQQIAWAYTHVEIMRYQGLRTLAGLAAKKEPGPEASINKLFWSEYHRRLGEVAMEVLGPEALVRPEGDGYRTDRWQAAFLGSRAGTIYAGSNEIQRNIVGERALGLPKEPS
ncbi:MAG TPA: acyl-CoA dehydrogenase family protein [Candidatus Dormibacteraeota bacterium]|nr:acyl-CoA dehydrogenase family protein [Candidatus Dormibacteraeota bacterium]